MANLGLEMKDGNVFIEHRGKQLTAVPHHKMQARVEEVSAKELISKLAETIKPKKIYRPNRRHPWKRNNRHRLSSPCELVCF